MSKKLDSVRRSLFKEFDDDESLNKSGFDSSKTSRNSIKFNSNFITAAVIFTILVAAFSTGAHGPSSFFDKKNLLTLIKDGYSEFTNEISSTMEWTHFNHTYLIQPLLFAVLISVFTNMIIYFDSEIPGVSPPIPFSPRKANQIRYAIHEEKTNHLGLLVSIGSGLITFFLLYL